MTGQTTPAPALRRGITPGQAKAALKDYPHLRSFLAVWFPAGKSIAEVIRGGGVGRPVERWVIARADVQSVLDALTYAISLLTPLDQRIVAVRYIEGRDIYGTAAGVGVSRSTLYNRLDVIHASVAALMSGMDVRYWRAFRRFARAVLAADEEQMSGDGIQQKNL